MSHKISESSDQIALFNMANAHIYKYPELEYLYAVPNGGHRHKAVAAKLKREGVKAGYPDIALDVARGGYHGLRIELKVGKNTASLAQKKWNKFLNEQGYKALIVWGWERAWFEILGYLNG